MIDAQVEEAKPSIKEAVIAAVVKASEPIPNDGKGYGDSPAKDKKKEKNAKKMRKWPTNKSATVSYEALISPLKKILEDGYRLVRKDKSEFEYDGYNIGKQELRFFPPPNYRLSKKLLEHEKKANDRSLFDVVLHIVFLLGMEQGRRSSRPELPPINKLIEAMERYRRDNRRLRYKVDELDARMKLKLDLPDAPEDEFEAFLKSEVEGRKLQRFAEAKKDLGEDPLKSLRIKPEGKLIFSELLKMAKVIKDECSKIQWKDILKDHGWNVNDWNTKCKHNNVVVHFHK